MRLCHDCAMLAPLPLTCHLTAPFRTFLNINSEQAAANPAAAARLLVDAATRVQATSEWDITTPWASLQSGFRRYATISDDFVSLFAQPLFIVRPPAAMVAEWRAMVLQALIDRMGPLSPAFDLRLDRIEFRLFDNTIGVLTLLLVAQSDRDDFLAVAIEHLDALTDMISARLVADSGKVAQMLVGALAQSEAKGATAGGKPLHLVRPKGKFLSFSDLNGLETADGGGGGSGEDAPVFLHLWTNRILFVPEAAYDASVATMIRQRWKVPADDLRILPHVEGLAARINIGNSLFVGAAERFIDAGLSQIMAGAQFFYAQLDVLKHNMGALYAELYEHVPMARFRRMRERISRTNSQVNFILSELSDYRLGIQGTRKWYFEELYDCFLFDLLIESVRQKQQTVQERAADLQARLFARIDGFIEALIFFLGAMTLIDLTLALLGFAKGDSAMTARPNVEYVDGVLAWLRTVPSDLVLSIITLIVLIFLMIFMIRRRQ
jgi:hypothetical protein